MMTAEDNLLRRVDILQGLSSTDEQLLSSYVQERTVSKNSFIYTPGELSDWVYFVLEGVVKTGTISDEGKEVIKNIFHPGEMFGELGISGMERRPDFAATLKSEAVLLRIPVKILKELIGRNPEVGLRMIEKLGQRISRSEKRLERLVFDDARTRVIEFLKDQAEKNGERFGDETMVRHSFTHQDMANFTGTSRQLVTIILNDLKRDDLINFDRSSILIRDLAQLK